jgi:hypothetical protein
MFNNKQEVIEVNEYGLFAFCAKIQELIKQGYEIDLTSNVRAPMSYGTMFVAYMTRNTSVPTTDSERVDVPTPESEVLPTKKVVESQPEVTIVKVKPETTFIETPGKEVNTELVAEKPQVEEKVEDKPSSEQKEPKVKKKAGAAE